MLVGDIRTAVQRLPNNAPVVFRILSGPEGISITTWLNPGPDKLEVVFEVRAGEDEDDK